MKVSECILDYVPENFYSVTLAFFNYVLESFNMGKLKKFTCFLSHEIQWRILNKNILSETIE